MKYSWEAFSNDGGFEDKGKVWFNTKREAYDDMRANALEKMKWNTEWEDFGGDCNSIGYEVSFSQNRIIHKSYAGKYTYEIVEKEDKVIFLGREWEIIDEFTKDEEIWWFVTIIPDGDAFAEMWMNNGDGCIIMLRPNGQILYRYF